MSRLLFLLILITATRIHAQEPVAVSKEPRHKNVFENDCVRVLDVHIAPGDTSQFHKHATPSVFISLHPVKTGSQVIIEDGASTALSLDRTITFEGFYKSPRIHRVWNEDTAVFHVMDVEVLTKGDKNIGTPIAVEGFRQLFDAPPVRAYRVTLKSNQAVALKRDAAILVVGLSDGNNVMVNNKPFMKEGDFIFISPAQGLRMTNKAQQEYSFALLEFK